MNKIQKFHKQNSKIYLSKIRNLMIKSKNFCYENENSDFENEKTGLATFGILIR